MKSRDGKGEKRKIRREKSRRERVRRKKMQMREKVGRSRNTAFFQWFVAPEGRKVGSLKRRVRSQLARWEMKNCTPLWREAHFQVKMYKTQQLRTTFTSWDVEKVHAVVARSTFPSQNVQNTKGCGPLLAVEMSKKCTPLWREAHLEVKMFKTPGVRTIFGGWDVEKVHAVVARSTFPSQHVQNTRGSDHFWRLRCRKSARRCGTKHISKWKCSKHEGCGPLLEIQMSLRFTTLHYTTLHSTSLQAITLHYTPLHYITLHYTPVRSTTLNYTTPHYITLHYAPLHYTTLRYITLHYTPLHYITLYYTIFHYTSQPYNTTLHYTTTTTTTTQLHCTTLHYIPPHSTTPHYITLHYITLNDTAPQIDR